MRVLDRRLLTGPNVYFPRPAVRVTLDVGEVLALPVEQARAIARAAGMLSVRPGPAGSAFRLRFASRLVTVVVRRLAQLAGGRRVAVRARAGQQPGELVLALPWVATGRVDAFCAALGEIRLDGDPAAVRAALATAASRVLAADPGPEPEVPEPAIPVVMVTGTNGKTTTTRMLGAIARAHGLSAAWTSTDGVYHDGRLVDAGDYSGPQGALLALAQPGIDVVVCETARGGILRRGLGVAWNDVAVVTNVSDDHLGVDGVDTLDQLAEVKAVITTVTRPGGWCVLNADDPRTLAMRHRATGRPCVFSRDPRSPGIRAVLDVGGRGATVIDGWIAVLEPRADPVPVVRLAEVPMTLGGAARVNVENALAATAAAWCLGWPLDAVADGLRGFRPDRDSSGRMNVFSLGENTVIIDMAHNEASFAALIEICDALRPAGARLLLGAGTAGDRSDEGIVRLGEIAGLGADAVVIKPPEHYLRGRSYDSMVEAFRVGLARAGQEPLAAVHGEIECLEALVAAARPGDVLAMMTHEDRDRVVAWLTDHGATPDGPEELAAKVHRGG